MSNVESMSAKNSTEHIAHFSPILCTSLSLSLHVLSAHTATAIILNIHWAVY